jgi:hypothetical protein
MIKINLEYLYGLHGRFAPLADLVVVQTRVFELIKVLTECASALVGLYGPASLYQSHLRLSQNQANRLFEEVDRHVRALAGDQDAEISATEIATLRDLYSTFKVVLEADLASVKAYLVSQRKPFDLTMLLIDGSSLFPEGMVNKAPETKWDSLEAGKALAFELGTACGFHTFRIVEAVLKRYWDETSGGQDRPRLETIGNYAKEMESKKLGDEKVIESLKQITRLHRNPLIHPEVILTVEETIDTLGIARSVVGAMLRVLPDLPPTTSTPLQTREL